MNSKNLKLSEIKANIQHVLVNLEQLEQLSNEAGQDFEPTPEKFLDTEHVA